MTVPKFCSNCGGGRLLSEPVENAYRCLDCNVVRYLNSKPAVCAIIVRDGSVLLVKGYDSSRGWDLPGGFLRLGEVPEDGLARELYEEIRVQVSVVKLISAKIDLFGTQGEFSLNLFYEVTLLTEELIPSNEIAQFSWFSLRDLPVLEYQGTMQALQEFAQRFCLS